MAAVSPVWEGGGHFAFLGALVGALLVRDVLDGCGDGCWVPAAASVCEVGRRG